MDVRFQDAPNIVKRVCLGNLSEIVPANKIETPYSN